MTAQDKHALVMGGSTGIGLATAARFAQDGVTVTITGRDADKLAKAAAGIAGTVHTRVADATAPEQVAALFAEEQGYDYLVLSLSTSLGAGELATLDLDVLHAAFEGKFWGHLRTAQAALPRMRAGGSITFITAASARAALPGTTGLAAINGALEAIVPPLAAELAPLRVNGISPGVVDTPWWDGLPAGQRAQFMASAGTASLVGRVGHPAEVADAIVAVATNGFITGTILEVTGGANLAVGR